MARIKRVFQEDLAAMVSQWTVREVVKAEAERNRGLLLKAKQRLEKVLRRKPNAWPAVFNYAALAHQVCEHAISIANYERFVEHIEGSAEAWYNLGTVRQHVGRFRESVAALSKAVEIHPGNSAAWVNMGNAYLGLGERAQADAAYKRAMALEPDGWEAEYNRAHYLLLAGKWLAGWKAYEARWSMPGFRAQNAVSVSADRARQPLPWGNQPLEGRHLIVTEEQGYGDLFMSLRYAPKLRAMASRVTWAVRPECIELVRAAVTPSRVMSNADEMPSADYLVSCMSLHHRLRVTPKTVPDAYVRRL